MRSIKNSLFNLFLVEYNMKNLLILGIFLPLISFGQLNTEKPTIGIKVGNSFSTISSENSINWPGLSEKNKSVMKNPGVIFGIYTNSKKRKFFIKNIFYSFQHELLYHQKGYKYTNIPTSYVRERLNYLEINSNYNIILGKLYLHSGFYAGFLLGGKELRYNEDLGYSSFEYDAFSFVNVDHGFNTGFSIPINNSMRFSFRYAQGLINYDTFTTAKNITYQATLNYIFPREKIF